MNLFGRKGAFGDDLGAPVQLYFSEKAAPVTFMTDARPSGLDAHEQRIRVAIHTNLADPQHMSTRFALFPKLVSRAAEENHFPRPLRFRQRLWTHEAEHQPVAGTLILDDGRHQPAAFLKVDFHCLAS